MTVIAYKDGIMACDSLWTDDNIKATFKPKIVRISDQLVIGGSGDVDDRGLILLFRAWWKKWYKSPLKELDIYDLPLATQIKESCEQEVISLLAYRCFDKAKLFVITAGSNPSVHEITSDFYAIGSGAHMAIGAMAFGATAAEAVKIACKYELHCQELVHEVMI